MADEVGLQLEARVVGADVDAHEAGSCPIAGVDGAPGGWVVAVVSPGRVRWSVLSDASAVLAATRDCAAVGVDIPLGLPAGRARRRCDDLAAARLGRARSSVFPAPPREVLAAPDHPTACAMARAVTGRAISLQTFHITAKIAEWDALVLPDAVVEVHPELSFRALSPATAFAPKKTTRGAGQRIAALSRWVDPAVAFADLPPGARLDDVLDALAAAWSARRWWRGAADLLGGDEDARGRPMVIAV